MRRRLALAVTALGVRMFIATLVFLALHGILDDGPERYRFGRP